MTLKCALTSEPVEFPVVSPVSGAVFEQRLILKYLQNYGNVDPLTKSTLTADQLITLNKDLLQIAKDDDDDDNQRPHHRLSNRSISTILRYLQEEWDSMLLQVFELRKQVEHSNQQLQSIGDEQKSKCQLIHSLRSQLNSTRKELDQLRNISLQPPPLPPLPPQPKYRQPSQSSDGGSNSARNSPPAHHLPTHFVSSLPPTPIKNFLADELVSDRRTGRRMFADTASIADLPQLKMSSKTQDSSSRLDSLPLLVDNFDKTVQLSRRMANSVADFSSDVLFIDNGLSNNVANGDGNNRRQYNSTDYVNSADYVNLSSPSWTSQYQADLLDSIKDPKLLQLLNSSHSSSVATKSSTQTNASSWNRLQRNSLTTRASDQALSCSQNSHHFDFSSVSTTASSERNLMTEASTAAVRMQPQLVGSNSESLHKMSSIIVTGKCEDVASRSSRCFSVYSNLSEMSQNNFVPEVQPLKQIVTGSEPDQEYENMNFVNQETKKGNLIGEEKENFPISLSKASKTENVKESEQGVPEWAQGFDRLIKDPIGIKVFSNFLKTEHSQENIDFWLACEKFKTISNLDEMKKESRKIYNEFLAAKAFRMVNLSAGSRVSEKELNNPTSDMFVRGQKEIYELMKKDSYSRFIKSDTYRECLQSHRTEKAVPLKFINGSEVVSKEQKNNRRKSSIFRFNQINRK